MQASQVVYPAGARVRVGEICRNAKTGKAGLLPINRATWYKWLKAGRVPPGQKIGENTTVWPVEVILAIGKPAGDAPSSGPSPAAPAASASAAPLPRAGGPKRGPEA